MKRREGAADRSHDSGGLTTGFGAQRQDESTLAQRMAALNGDSRAHHAGMYELRPPLVPDVRAAVRRVAGTLDHWAFEIRERNDAMAGKIAGLARVAAIDMAAWPGLTSTPVTPRTDEGHPARTAAEAALEVPAELPEAIASFRDCMEQVSEGPAPGEDLPSLSPGD